LLFPSSSPGPPQATKSVRTAARIRTKHTAKNTSSKTSPPSRGPARTPFFFFFVAGRRSEGHFLVGPGKLASGSARMRPPVRRPLAAFLQLRLCPRTPSKPARNGSGPAGLPFRPRPMRSEQKGRLELWFSWIGQKYNGGSPGRRPLFRDGPPKRTQAAGPRAAFCAGLLVLLSTWLRRNR